MDDFKLDFDFNQEYNIIELLDIERLRKSKAQNVPQALPAKDKLEKLLNEFIGLLQVYINETPARKL